MTAVAPEDNAPRGRDPGPRRTSPSPSAVSRDVRADMRAVYASAAPRPRRRGAWRSAAGWPRRLGGPPAAAVAGELADPRLAALAETIARRDLPLDPFLRLIEANRMDQRRARWGTHEGPAREYRRHSATPVGEMVLGVLDTETRGGSG